MARTTHASHSAHNTVYPRSAAALDLATFYHLRLRDAEAVRRRRWMRGRLNDFIHVLVGSEVLQVLRALLGFEPVDFFRHAGLGCKRPGGVRPAGEDDL